MKWMRSLFLAALCRYITIDSATWTVFFNPAATTNTTIARQHSSSRFSSPPVHKIARAHTRRQWKWLHVILFFSRLLFFTRAHTSICLFFILATLHDIAHHRRAAWQQRLKANFFTIFFFFFVNDLPFWESQIRCLFTALDASMSRDYRVRFVSMQRFVQLALSTSTYL